MSRIFSVRGRLNRLPYLSIIASTVVLTLAVILSLSAMENLFIHAKAALVIDGTQIGACFVALVVGLCATIRRLHDFDQSGWWVPSFLVIDLLRGYFNANDDWFANGLTIILLIGIFTVVAMMPGSRQSNRFGERA